MKINKLKALSIAVCCVVIALCSGAQGMEYLTDTEGKTSIGTTSMQISSQNESDALDFEAIPSQSISVEYSSTSLASYLISPVKAAFQTANEFMLFARNNPKLAMFVGLSFAIPLAEAGCACYCNELVTPCQYNCYTRVVYKGTATGLTECYNICKRGLGGSTFAYCT